MSAQLVVFGDFASGHSARPAMTLRIIRTTLVVSPAVARAARIGAGGVVGLMFGAACGNFGLWLAMGLGLGWVLARLRG